MWRQSKELMTFRLSAKIQTLVNHFLVAVDGHCSSAAAVAYCPSPQNVNVTSKRGTFLLIRTHEITARWISSITSYLRHITDFILLRRNKECCLKRKTDEAIAWLALKHGVTRQISHVMHHTNRFDDPSVQWLVQILYVWRQYFFSLHSSF